MIQILLHNLKMDPLVSLHYYAPVCALINLFFLPFTEGLAPFYELQKVGILVLVSNAAVAFLLNVAAVFLVGVGSGLVLTLAGVFKVSLALSFHVFRFSLPLSGNILSLPYYGPHRVQVNFISVLGFLLSPRWVVMVPFATLCLLWIGGQPVPPRHAHF